MRHLKTYKIFELTSFDNQRPSDQNNLEDDVRDILMDFTDENDVEIEIKEVNYTPPMMEDSLKSLCVDIINKSPNTFIWGNDLKENLIRLEEYCFRKDGGYSIDIEVDGDYMHLGRFFDVYGSEEHDQITLYIYSEDDYGNLLNQKDMNESFSKWTGISQEYSIYDFINDLNTWNKNKPSYQSIKIWTNHFIGDGFYEKLDNHITKVWDAMKKVDLYNINDRFLELWDDIKYKDNWILPTVAYGDYYKDNYNGSMPISNLEDDDRRKDIMCEIIRSIIRPTLDVGYSSNEANIRNTKDEIFVTDEKYQCENFDFSNYSYFKGFSGDKLLWKSRNNDESIIQISSYEWKNYEMYSPENVMNMYVPCIYISIGDNNKRMGMTLSELESRLDDIVDTILPEIDYKEVIWDISRGTRRFSEDFDVSEYRLKILLNF